MKTSFGLLITSLSALGLFCELGIAAENSNSSEEQYAITERGPHHRVWKSTEFETGPQGERRPHVHTVTEVATGLHYKNQAGEWLESKEEIEILPNGTGAAASKGQHKIIFPADVLEAQVELNTPEGLWLRSQVMGLAYFDTVSGKSVLIAELKSSVGEVHRPNVVVYPDAFTDFQADVRYTYTLAGFEQDIVIHERPPSPEEYELDPATTRLQVLTEFFNPPHPAKTAVALTTPEGVSMADETLNFGAMTIGRGKAFSQEQQGKEFPVAKAWVKLEGRDLLIEEVPVVDLEDELQLLPVHQGAALKSKSGAQRRTASIKRTLPVRKIAAVSKRQMKLALNAAPKTGFVLDYNTVNTSQTNYVFDGYSTYYLSGNVSLNGTNTTFEGGTVIKYASNVSLTVNTPVTWTGQSYLPVVMVSKDDNRVGENISGSTGNPGTSYYAARALYLDSVTAATNFTLMNLRIANAQTAIAINGGTNVLGNVQLLNCRNGLALTNAEVSLRNALMYQVLTNFTGSSSTGRVEHLTSDTAIWLNQSIGANLFLTNSLLVAVTNLGSVTRQDVSVETTRSGVFQTAGAADHYLISGSTNRNLGTTNISSALLAELRTKTTYPPIVYSNMTISLPTTFSPQAQRDTDTPDRGYEYDVLDYVFGGLTANSNVTFTAGTAIGWFELPGSGGPGYGLSLPNSISATFNGTVTSPCILARYSTVQEGVNALWKDKGWLAGIRGTGSFDTSNPSQIIAAFLKSYLLAAGPCHFRDYNNMLLVRGNHCEFYNGNQGGYNTQSSYTNCLFDRIYIVNNTSSSAASFILRNCTHHGGWVDFGHSEPSAPYWYSSIKDCAFDRTIFSMGNPSSGNPLYVENGTNAYVTGLGTTTPAGSGNVTVTSFDWQIGNYGPGKYYLPSGSPLIDAGSTTANLVGLYHFTSVPWSTKDANSVVDIGYHYVATDSSGNPLDDDSDGMPDYVEDANGNGVYDNNETDWTSPTDNRLGIWITRPRIQSIVP